MKTLCLIMLAIGLVTNTDAQNADVDTTRSYVEYPQRLFLGYYQSLQRYTINIKPGSGLSPFSHSYTSGTRISSGIEIGYGKLFLSVNFHSLRNNTQRTGNNKSFTSGFALGSNKLQFEGLYQYHRGFYDTNSPEYNPAYNDPNPYYRKPSFKVNLFRLNVLYYPNHNNFSAKALQGNNFRQMHSAFSPVMALGFFRIRMKSLDGLINQELEVYFDNASSIYGFGTTGISFGGGLAGTVVFANKLFVGGNGLIYLEPQVRHYRFSEAPNQSVIRAPLSAEIRLVTGYNSEKFYTAVWFNSAVKPTHDSQIRIVTNRVAAGFTLAFRMKIKKEPPWIQKIKATGFYNRL